MIHCRKVALIAALVLISIISNAAERKTIQIKVLDSKTRSISTENNSVPRNCDLSNYDAYCHGTKEAQVINTLLVQEGNDPPYRIRCSNDSKWSRCAALPKGTFDARKEKHGLTVYYVDDEGKVRKQLYTYVLEDGRGNPLAATLPAAAKSSPPTAESGEQTPAAEPAANSQATVKCSFNSTPPGAEVTLDGRYVGSTPSVMDVSTGKHTVAVTMPGFVQWKRELTVSPGSELTVNAILQKSQ